jgi:hypothetical protein
VSKTFKKDYWWGSSDGKEFWMNKLFFDADCKQHVKAVAPYSGKNVMFKGFIEVEECGNYNLTMGTWSNLTYWVDGQVYRAQNKPFVTVYFESGFHEITVLFSNITSKDPVTYFNFRVATPQWQWPQVESNPVFTPKGGSVSK